MDISVSAGVLYTDVMPIMNDPRDDPSQGDQNEEEIELDEEDIEEIIELDDDPNGGNFI